MLRTLALAAIILVGLSCLAAQAQTQAQTRQQVLQYLEAGRLPDAIAMGEKAVSRWPDDPEIRHWLGLAYFKSGQLEPAREQLERALEPQRAGHRRVQDGAPP